MQPTDSQRITVQLRRVFRRHKPLVAISLVVFLAPAFVYNQMATPTYEASTSMIFDEVAAPMPTPDNDMSRELQLANRLEELGSVAFAQDIARALPAEVRQRFEFGPTATDIDTLETITKVIHKNMTAHPLRNSNVVEIAVQLQDPGLATIVANTAAPAAATARCTG